jgi:hypothetical protein
MSHGAGKYDALATYVRKTSGGSAVLVMVLDGHQGEGFSVQADSPKLLAMMPSMLRAVAEQLERDIGEF